MLNYPFIFSQKDSPEENANIFSRLTFYWMTPLMKLGHEKYLVLSDLWNLNSEDRSKTISTGFEAVWKKELSKKNPSLFKALVISFGGPFAFAAFFKAIQDMLNFVQPQLLKQIMIFVSQQDDDEDKPSALWGYSIAAMMFLTAILQTMFLHQYFHLCAVSGMRTRAGLITIIYKKAIRLSNSARQGSTIGEIVNHMSVDTQKNRGFDHVLTHRMNEILNGIKVIKLYAWESAFLKRIFEVRHDRELSTLKKLGYLASVQSFTWAATVSSFFYLHSEVVFVALALFNLLQFPLALFPIVIASIVEAAVAIGRIRKFLSAEELNPNAITREPYIDSSHPKNGDKDGVELISVKNGTFKWSQNSSTPVLEDINFSVRKGELVAIVGSGKSSLLSALLGEMEKISGEVTVRGYTAYAPQSDNITFGLPYDPTFYEEVIEACSLKPDIEILPGGDLTEIGEKGINLSGGQKARISLARAVYARADLYLFDDPLSAVDAHVGKHIFDNVIGPTGLLRTKARVFVTNGIHFLSRTNSLIMLREGKIVEQGHFDSLMKQKQDLHNLIIEYGQQSPEDDEDIQSPSLVETYEIDEANVDYRNEEISRSPRERRVSVMSLRRRPSLLTTVTTASKADVEHGKDTLILSEDIIKGKVSWDETLGGVTTIRAYQQSKRFIVENEIRLDENQKAYYPSLSCNRWLAIRLEFLGSLIIFSASLLAVISSVTSNNIDAGLVGLSLSYALSVTQALNWVVRQFCEIETNIVSVERAKEYIDLPNEAPSVVDLYRPSPTWPQNGLIEYKDYSTRYRTGLELVLKGVSFVVKPREKIGIVGRTGAGKSSLTLSLFRLIEAAGGTIIVDGMDISKMGLYDLRSRLTIIPQDPTLFEGTVLFNLDPFTTRDDVEIWQALQSAHLKDYISQLDGKLQAKVIEGGDNFSQGQRQLLCLARALLRRSPVIVLDEATASVDVETDAKIQKTIRTEFNWATLLCIAHRLRTIIDYDRVLVLDRGKVAEFDTPYNLLQNKNSVFRHLCEESNEFEYLMDLATKRMHATK
ncbi:8866_t:CDS:10 [Racocetra persica]|uniref:8866_t:CDS:1 n=1 Tax=Racocetra persica TaxID=160502 RepID=A0ACA9KGZ2_9GLOM|nr:8866_t:CDS:10 [Racocetra persica]